MKFDFAREHKEFRNMIWKQNIRFKYGEIKMKNISKLLCLLAISSIVANTVSANKISPNKITAKIDSCFPEDNDSKCFSDIRYETKNGAYYPFISLTADEQSKIAFDLYNAHQFDQASYENAKRKAIQPVATALCMILGYMEVISYSTKDGEYSVKGVQIKDLDGVPEDYIPFKAFRIDSWRAGDNTMSIVPTTFDRVRCR